MTADSTRPEATKSETTEGAGEGAREVRQKQQQRKRRERRKKQQEEGDEGLEEEKEGKVEESSRKNLLSSGGGKEANFNSPTLLTEVRRRSDWRRETVASVPSWWNRSFTRRRTVRRHKYDEDIFEEEEEEEGGMEVMEATGQVMERKKREKMRKRRKGNHPNVERRWSEGARVRMKEGAANNFNAFRWNNENRVQQMQQYRHSRKWRGRRKSIMEEAEMAPPVSAFLGGLALSAIAVPGVCAVEWQGDSFQTPRTVVQKEMEKRRAEDEEEQDEGGNGNRWEWRLLPKLLRRKSSRVAAVTLANVADPETTASNVAHVDDNSGIKKLVMSCNIDKTEWTA